MEVSGAGGAEAAGRLIKSLRNKKPSPPASGVSENQVQGNLAAPQQGNKQFKNAVEAGKRGAAGPTQRQKPKKNLASKLNSVVGATKGKIPGLGGSGGAGNSVGSNTNKLKKAGKDATRSLRKGQGANGDNEGGSDDTKASKGGVANRAGRTIKNLGKERCRICGYQNGIGKDGRCKRCTKLNRKSSGDTSKTEKLKNEAIDKTAKAAAIAAGQFANKFSGGIIPASVVKNLSEGFIGKALAANAKVGGLYVKVFILAPIAIFLFFGFGIFIAIASGGSSDLFEQQEEAATGTPEENASDIQGDLTSAYIEVANNYGLPWSVLAGIGKSTTDHGRVSPYDDVENRENFPFVSPAIVGEGFGPMLLTGDSITSGGQASLPIGDVDIPDPNTLDLEFVERPGLNPGGNLQPVAAAASDFINAAWPNNPIVSDWRPPDGFNEHNSGRALDIGCPIAGACTPEDVERLHTVAAWFLQNPNAFEVQHLIWEQRIHSGAGWSPMGSRGSPTANHYDHVHIFFKDSNQRSLGELGGALPQSSLEEVSANTSNNPFNSGGALNTSSGSSSSNDTVTFSSTTDNDNGGTNNEDEGATDAEETGETGEQSYIREINRLAELLVSARKSVYNDNREEYEALGITEESLSIRPYRSEETIEFWGKVVQRLPIDFRSAQISSGGGGGNGSGNVALGEEKDAVVSQIVWSTRWIESGNDYTQYGGPSDCYTGAYQFGYKNTFDANGNPVCYDTWGGFAGAKRADLAEPADQDKKMTEVVSSRFDAYEGDVRKIVQSHLCPAQVGNDTAFCGNNPDMGTYWACAAVLLNALPGNEDRYQFAWTGHFEGPSGLASYKANCEARIERALQDEQLPSEARSGGGSTTSPTSPETTSTTQAPQENQDETPENSGPPTTGAEVWDRLAQCESNEDWALNSGNGFYGGIQFLKETWDAQNGTEFAEFPHEATREEQIKVAQRLLEAANWAQWPACTEQLGYRTAEGDVPEIRTLALEYNPDEDTSNPSVPVRGGGGVTAQDFAEYALQVSGQYAGLDLGLVDIGEGDGQSPGGPPSDQTPSPRGFIWPSGGPISSAWRTPGRTGHRGIDLDPGDGTPVYASKAGTVTLAFTTCTIGHPDNPCGGGFGNHIYIDHGNGELTIYAHLRVGSVTVQEGDQVTIGQQIAQVGHTGDSTGPHLHFEIRVNDEDVNPVLSLPDLQ